MTIPAAIAALSAPDARLGLQSGQVDLTGSNPRWAELYVDLAQHLGSYLAVDDSASTTIAIEHIGSTSVPGLPAKPLLDVAIGARAPIDNEHFIERLESAGCSYELDLGLYGGLLFTIASDEDHVVAHVHVVDIDDFQWRWYLAFRDGLRADPDLRSQYADLKRGAAQAHADDRDSYTRAKFDWVLATVSALADGPSGTEVDLGDEGVHRA